MEPIHPRYAHESVYIKDYVSKYVGQIPNNISKWVVRLALDKHMMALKYVSAEDITVHLLERFTDIFIVPSHEYIRIYILDSEFTKVADIEKYVSDIFLGHITSTYVKGVPFILDAKVKVLTKYSINATTGAFDHREEFVINTVGSNHNGLFEISEILEYADLTQILTNDVVETAEIFGIEAARNRTIDTIIENLEGKPPSYAHLSIYGDTLTWSGELVPIEKSLLKEHDKTLLKASHNFASKNIIQGAKFGVHERANGITSSVMMGGLPRIGTHYSNILMDHDVIITQSSGIIDVINSL
jgi:DNA-directed RNA polymerase beta' subunit